MDALVYYTGSIDGLELYDALLKPVRESKNRIGVLKALYITHNTVNLIGDPFNKVVLREFYPNTLPTSKASSPGSLLFLPFIYFSEDYLLGILVANYYNIIVSYAHYYEDIKDFINMNPQEIATSITDADPTPMIKLLTFKNIVKYFGIVITLFSHKLIPSRSKTPSKARSLVLSKLD